MKTIWKDIAGYEGLYKISNKGAVKKLGRIEGKKVFKEKIIKQSKRNGYRQLSLRKNKLNIRFIVHRLMGFTFLQNPENKPQINHLNGIRHDNRVENLEWCTHSENRRHAVEFLNASKKKVQLNGKYIFHSIQSAEKVTGICKTTISQNVNGHIETTKAGTFKFYTKKI